MTKRPWTSGKLKVRHRSDGITSGFEISINKEQFPYGITAPADPFMLGKCVAVVATEADARLFASAGGMYEALEALLHDPYSMIRDSLRKKAEEAMLAANPDAFGSAEGEEE